MSAMRLQQLFVVIAWTVLGACANGSAHDAPLPTLGNIKIVSTTTGGGSAPAVALSPSGERVIAWIGNDSAGTPALYVQQGDAPPRRILDPLGDIQRNAEAPPQLVYGPGGTLYLSYILARDVGKRFPESALRFVHSQDDGATWSPAVTVTDDHSDFGSHNFHSLAVSPDGRLYLAWLDGRTGEQAAYFASSTDHGRHWSANTQLSVGETCPCCRTALAAGRNGVVYVAWRAVLPGSERDIVVAKSVDGGITFGEPVRVHDDKWVYTGCPHAGPSIQVDTAGTVHVLWWTGVPGQGGVFYASSHDQGATFGNVVPIMPQKTPMPTHVALSLQGIHPVAVWDAMTLSQSSVAMRMSRDGGRSFGDVVTVSDDDALALHPRIVVQDTSAMIAWVRNSNVTSSHGHGHSHAHASQASRVTPKSGEHTSIVAFRIVTFGRLDDLGDVR